jgi:hypothetical protein
VCFFVKKINSKVTLQNGQIGECDVFSAPYLTSDACLAANPHEVAERMAPPTVGDVQRDSMMVKWVEPANNGGAPIKERQ